MYNHLEGKLTHKAPTQIVLDVNGVGYELAIPLSTYRALPAAGEAVRVCTHLQVREDAHQLYGFFTEEERSLFRLLLSVSGIGPKLGLTVLSGLEIQELKKAIIDENLVLLTGISGIGRKTAERIIIELREKVLIDERLERRRRTAAVGDEEAVVEDTLSALVSLGYRKQTAQEAIQKVLAGREGRALRVEELIKATLKVI